MKESATQISGMKMFLVFLAIFFSFTFVSSADISKTWDCTGGLDHCENFRVYTNSEKTEGPYCGLARSIYGYEDPIWQRTADLYFNVSKAGVYTCNLSIAETGYGYYDSVQTNEKSSVYFNGFFLGNTTDGYCNFVSPCADCRNHVSSFTFTKNLSLANNLIHLTPYQSHALRSASVSCNYVPPVCTPSAEICDGIDNDCDGQIDENLFRSSNQTGICSINTQTCSNGNWLNSSNNTNPQTEVCDGIDNNCNGQVDEGNVCTSVCTLGQTRTCSTGLSGVCSAGTQTCSNNSWGSCVQNVFGSTEVCNSLDDDCDGQIDEGLNCNPQCTIDVHCSGNNFNSANFCFNDDVYMNTTMFSCVSNTCQPNSPFKVFVEECGQNSFVNSSPYCSGNNLVKNVSSTLRGCLSGSCFVNNQNNVEVLENCANGCSNNACNNNSNNGTPSCTVDYLANSQGQNIFNLSNHYFNQTGSFFVVGSANSNSDSFVLRYIGYNRSSPNYFLYSWRSADNQGAWQIWRTDQTDLAFTNGIHEVCCKPESQRCVGDCEVRAGEASCESFCIDSQAPTVSILNVAGMSNWNASTFIWTWNASDIGCAGLKNYNFTFKDVNGTVLQSNSNYSGNSLVSSGLVANHSYLLTVYAFDNAGNFGNAVSNLLVVGSSPNNQTNNNSNDNNAVYVKIVSPVNGSVLTVCNNFNLPVYANWSNNITPLVYSLDGGSQMLFNNGSSVAFHSGQNNITLFGVGTNSSSVDSIVFIFNNSCTNNNDNDNHHSGSANNDVINLNSYDSGQTLVFYNNTSSGIFLGNKKNSSSSLDLSWLLFWLILAILILMLLIIIKLIDKKA